MSIKINPQKSFKKAVSIPSDKSITQRAVIIGGLFNGITIENPILCGDCLSALKCVKTLGGSVDFKDNFLVIKAGGKQSARLNAENSATLMRLMAGAAAGQGISLTIDGDFSLRKRNMLSLIDVLKKMGAQITSRDGFCPLTIKKSNLNGINFAPQAPSAQIKSAVLLAGLGANGTTRVLEKLLTRDHTERLLGFLGADISVSGKEITVNQSAPQNKIIKIAGDISSAAFMLAAALISPDGVAEIKNVGLNPLRTGIIDVLKQAGADIFVHQQGIDCGEPFGSITARSSKIKGFEVGKNLIPSLIDEIPVLAVCACFAEGISTFKGLSALKNKESDRMTGVCQLLKSFGAKAELKGDTLIVEGGTLNKTPVIFSRDHRLIMAASVLGICAAGCIIKHPAYAAVSYPQFFKELLK